MILCETGLQGGPLWSEIVAVLELPAALCETVTLLYEQFARLPPTDDGDGKTVGGQQSCVSRFGKNPPKSTFFKDMNK